MKTTQPDDECAKCGRQDLDYYELTVAESGNVEQEVSCPRCGERWVDLFVFSERRPLVQKRAT